MSDRYPTSLRRLFEAAIALAVAACLSVGLPTPASAELYKYEKPDGSTLITTEKRSDYKLIEVISDGSSAAVSTVNSRSGRDGSGRAGDEARSKRERQRQKRREAERRTDEQYGETKRKNARTDYSGPRQDRFDDLIDEASEAYGVPFSFIKAVIRVESNFHPNATSHAGAMGLMQLMPKTAEYLNVTDPFNPRQNVFGGTKLLRILTDRYDGDINLILSAYNAGDGAVREYNGIPYRQTRQYVASVYRFYKLYSTQYGDTDEEESQ